MKPWLRLNADFPLDGAVRETGFAWAWPFILSALKRSSSFGRLSDTDLGDRVLFEVAQVPGCPAGRSYTIRDAYASVGLLIPLETGGWTTPEWDTYQEDPTKADRQQRYREHNRERIAEADRRRYAERTGRLSSGDVPRRSATSNDVAGNENGIPTTPNDAQRRSATPDGTGRDRTGQEQQNNSMVEAPPSEPVTPVNETAAAIYAFWVETFGKSGVAAKTSTSAAKVRLGHIVGRLRDGYTVEQLRAAIVGCSKSPFHNGQNNDGKVYDDLELIMRPGKIDKFIAEANRGRQAPAPTPAVPTSTRRTGNTDPIPERNVWEHRNRAAAAAAETGSGR